MQAGTALGNFANVFGAQAAARPEEAAVIAELKAGSEEAFASLIAQYHSPLYSLIARTIPDPCEAADITQDVFIKIYRGIGNFHGESSLRTWIYRIALHEASNQRRWWCRHKRKEITIEHELSAEDGEAFHLKDTLVDQHESPVRPCRPRRTTGAGRSRRPRGAGAIPDRDRFARHRRLRLRRDR